MNKLLTVLVASAVSLSFNAAEAHGSASPKHEGQLQMVGDMSIELVAHANGAELYLEDDGDELPTDDMTAKLTIVNKDGSKSEATMKPAGGNKLEAKDAKIASGAKVAALVTLKDKKKIPASFTIK